MFKRNVVMNKYKVRYKKNFWTHAEEIVEAESISCVQNKIKECVKIISIEQLPHEKPVDD